MPEIELPLFQQGVALQQQLVYCIVAASNQVLQCRLVDNRDGRSTEQARDSVVVARGRMSASIGRHIGRLSLVS